MPLFFERDNPGLAAIYFPGDGPPPDGSFGRLRDHGITVTSGDDTDAIWSLKLQHPEWGRADLKCVRDNPPIDDFTRFAVNLTAAEKVSSADARSVVILWVPASKKHVLRDRKVMLRFASAILGEDGAMVVDLATTLPWSKAALEDELAHDAELDVEAIYCIHEVIREAGTQTEWLHTHGLGEIGAFDFDVVKPSRTFVDGCAETFRAIAFQILAGGISDSSERVALGNTFEARFVPAEQFMHSASLADRTVRQGGLDGHIERRSVICEPQRRRLFRRGGETPTPHRLPQQDAMSEGAVLFFPAIANALMAERAQKTFHLLPGLLEEFAEFEPSAIVKVGHPTDDGSSREHLWFDFHGISDGGIDATLQNTPYGVAGLRSGDRGVFPVEWLSDWVLIGPTGWITPRSQAPARRLRENLDQTRAAFAEWRQARESD